jgi:hypothetical protein
MNEKLRIISEIEHNNNGLVRRTIYFDGSLSKEDFADTEYEGKQIVRCTGWSGEPQTMIQTESVIPTVVIYVKE